LPGLAEYSPVRIVLDGALRLPLGSRLAQTAGEFPVWVIADMEAQRPAEEALRAEGIEVLRTEQKDGRIDLGAALKLIAARGITRLMVEGGPTLAGALVAADLVDEAHLLHSPKIAGETGVDALEGIPLTALTESDRLQRVGCFSLGTDCHDVYERR
jgi:diaminohydroxyphosphoribosylaminopyrimidine deaminase/5-amino-6-(5-phosphoribosylamino)uracil reductase